IGVVRLEVLVGERPGRRDAAVVPNLAEVLLAEAEEDCSVDLRVAADVVLSVRPERNPMLVDPHLFGDVALLPENLPGIPVLRLAREVATALEDQDAQTARGEPVGERAAAGPAADDDHVVVVGHSGPPSQT